MLYDDPNDNGVLDDVVLLTSSSGTIASSDTDIFIEYPIVPTEVSGNFLPQPLCVTCRPENHPFRLTNPHSTGRPIGHLRRISTSATSNRFCRTPIWTGTRWYVPLEFQRVMGTC